MSPPTNGIPASSGEQEPQQGIAEKYMSLKRRFDQLEEESNSGSNGSGEPRTGIREEREFLLGKMTELEQTSQIHLNTVVPQDSMSTGNQNTNASVTDHKAQNGQNLLSPSRTSRMQSQRHAEGTESTNDTAMMDMSGNQLSNQGGDVHMQDGQAQNVQNSASTQREATVTSPRRETRSTRQTRSSRNDGTVIAAVAAATAEAEAAAASQAQSVGRASVTQSPPTTSTSPSSTLAHALGPTPMHSTKDMTSVSPQPHMQHTPSMESILKVAEAAVAAQNAAAAANQAAKSGPSSGTDANLDPSLTSGTNKAGQSTSKDANGHNALAAKPPTVNTSTTPSNNTTPSSSTATPTSATPTPTSSLSNNPYLSLTTNLLARTGGTSASPTGHPMMMPYPMFYPPGTPVTPNSPSYPMAYNPYYYLAAPMVPGPSNMYAPPPATIPSPSQQRSPPEPQKPVKAKRLKSHTVTTKSFSIPMVPRDKKGKPMLPLNVGIMTVISLGDVCMREHFHTERYIFPVGYEVTRRYLSTVDPTIEVVYHCTILDGGDGPKFQIIPSDRPDKPIIAGTATGAWSNIVKQANAIRNRQHSNSVSGPDFFGLGQNTIKHLIQQLPNADRLRDYVWQNFVEGGPLGGRHAAVIPALPEEYDASMPIGAYYPKRDLSDPNVPRGLSHYPQHIIAQAEAQRAQKLLTQQQQQQQQQQDPAVAGPSGASSISQPQQPQQPQQQQQQPQQQQTSQVPQMPAQVDVGAVSGILNIHEYQPMQAQSSGKRATRNDATASSTPSTTGRNTRAAARGNQQQQQQQQEQQQQQQQQQVQLLAQQHFQQQFLQSQQVPVNGTEGFPSLAADGTMPTTFAGIMNAYPAPGVSSTANGVSNSSVASS
ncbi:Transforming growth factor beta regulator 1 [Psilocybe cubensis]|uniref:Transforming growth factor beta regulator 1 n=2 Tax=Psilocybe cubensis TaxID=181762 RepID=A0ACB8GYT1_PSICU|nr:Transforming growth factor beta regulator 1 [Psilocybe cubensis]KAH9480736.1 Transforming growth factor beta regulator 1 [Psilocybe cubensis]